MAKKEYLNEENYQKTKKAIKLVLIIIFTLGISLGGYLIYKGIGNQPWTKSKDPFSDRKRYYRFSHRFGQHPPSRPDALH